MKILGIWSRKRKEKKKKNITRISRSNRHQSLVPREAKFLLSLDSLTPSFHIDNIDVVRVLTKTRMSCSGNFAPLVGRRKVQYPLDCRRGESIIVYKACKRAKSSLETTQCLTDQFPVFFGLLCDMETVLPLHSSSTAPLRFSFFLLPGFILLLSLLSLSSFFFFGREIYFQYDFLLAFPVFFIETRPLHGTTNRWFFFPS